MQSGWYRFLQVSLQCALLKSNLKKINLSISNWSWSFDGLVELQVKRIKFKDKRLQKNTREIENSEMEFILPSLLVHPAEKLVVKVQRIKVSQAAILSPLPLITSSFLQDNLSYIDLEKQSSGSLDLLDNCINYCCIIILFLLVCCVRCSSVALR